MFYNILYYLSDVLSDLNKSVLHNVKLYFPITGNSHLEYFNITI